MAFNTRPRTIAEINSWTNKRVTAAKEQLKRTDPSDPLYDYLVERIKYMESYTAARSSLVGKKLPPPRDRSNEKNLPEHLKTKKRR